MTYTTIKIPKELHVWIGDLAAKTHLSRQEVMQRSLKELEEKLFWEECQNRYKALADSGIIDDELRLYENTLADGLEDEY